MNCQVHATPFNLKSLGVAGVPVPMNPNVMLPPFAGMVPFQWPAGLLAVTVLSFCE